MHSRVFSEEQQYLLSGLRTQQAARLSFLSVGRSSCSVPSLVEKHVTKSIQRILPVCPKGSGDKEKRGARNETTWLSYRHYPLWCSSTLLPGNACISCLAVYDAHKHTNYGSRIKQGVKLIG